MYRAMEPMDGGRPLPVQKAVPGRSQMVSDEPLSTDVVLLGALACRMGQDHRTPRTRCDAYNRPEGVLKV